MRAVKILSKTKRASGADISKGQTNKPVIWNNLPTQNRCITELDEFKSQIKRYYIIPVRLQLVQLPIGNQIMCYFTQNYLLITKSCDNSCMYSCVYMFVEICCKPIVCVVGMLCRTPHL